MSRRRAFRALDRTAPGPDPDAFIMTFALGASDSITLPLVSGGSYNFTVEWGDGTSDVITAWNQAERVHNYTGLPAGDYVVTITGVCTAWSFFSVNTSRLKIKSVDQWGDTGLRNLSFINCTNLTSVSGGLIFSGGSLSEAFRNTRLVSLPSNLFQSCPSVTSFVNTFVLVSTLTSIPAGLFDNCPSVTSFAGCFGFTAITSVPSDLFRYNTAVTDFSSTFASNSLLTSIPTDLFRYNTLVTNFSGTFNGNRLSSIPTDLFRYNTLVTNFSGTFNGNSTITSLPTDLFRYNTSVATFNETFMNCTGITSVPADLFQYNTAVTVFQGVLRNTRIVSVPTDFFRYNTAATDFSNAFVLSITLTTIPTDLFRYNTSVTNFAATFRGTALTSIPTDLFRYNVSATNFNSTFFGITTLTSIPTDTFNYNVNATNYAGTFSGCTNLATSVSSLVSGMDMTKVTTTNQMFFQCTSLTGNGQDLINKPKAAGYTVGTASNTGSHRTFFGCTALTDFATIPAEYK